MIDETLETTICLHFNLHFPLIEEGSGRNDQIRFAQWILRLILDKEGNPASNRWVSTYR